MQSRLPQSRIRNELFVTLTKDLYSLLGKICCFKITIQKCKRGKTGKNNETLSKTYICYPAQAVTSDKILLSVFTSYEATVEMLILFVGNYKRTRSLWALRARLLVGGPPGRFRPFGPLSALRAGFWPFGPANTLSNG